VVEINPGYLDLIRSYPDLAPLLTDPRTHIFIDDGRRWLRRNPDARYDLIVQNTTFYWRANSANLLSREYFLAVQRHLAPGGVLAVNTTGSFDVFATLHSVFPYSYRYSNFGYASDHGLQARPERLREVRRPDGPMFTFAGALSGSVADMLTQPRMVPVEKVLESGRNHHPGIITDDNLLSEYRDGKHFGPVTLQVLLPPETEPGFF
jgi:hypothetical protein